MRKENTDHVSCVCVAAHTPGAQKQAQSFRKQWTHTPKSAVWGVVVVDVAVGLITQHQIFRECMCGDAKVTTRGGGEARPCQVKPPLSLGKEDTWTFGWVRPRETGKKELTEESVGSLGALNKHIEVSWSGLNQRG